MQIVIQRSLDDQRAAALCGVANTGGSQSSSSGAPSNAAGLPEAKASASSFDPSTIPKLNLQSGEAASRTAIGSSARQPVEPERHRLTDAESEIPLDNPGETSDARGTGTEGDLSTDSEQVAGAAAAEKIIVPKPARYAFQVCVKCGQTHHLHGGKCHAECLPCSRGSHANRRVTATPARVSNKAMLGSPPRAGERPGCRAGARPRLPGRCRRPCPA